MLFPPQKAFRSYFCTRLTLSTAESMRKNNRPSAWLGFDGGLSMENSYFRTSVHRAAFTSATA